MGITQTDVVRLLSTEIAQHNAHEILSAYCYAKLSKGNLPIEVLGKCHAVHRKLILVLERKGMALPVTSPVGRAFEAIKSQLSVTSRKYSTQGPAAFGNLARIGTASSVNAIQAWTKATDGKVLRFENGENARIARDVGRASRDALAQAELPPPIYLAAEADVPTATTTPTPTNTTGLSNDDIAVGRARLALLKEQMDARQNADAAMVGRIVDNGNSPMGMNGSSHHTMA